MINILLAHDNKDEILGVSFEQCASLSKNILLPIAQIVELDSNSLNKETVENTISQFDQHPFLFIAYSHGKDDALEQGYERYVSVENAYFFGTSFVYTFACYTANELGNALIAQNCHTFIGYDKEVRSVIEYHNIFAQCAVYGLERFIAGETTGMIWEEMRNNYTQTIDSIDAYAGDFTVLYNLRKNRDALILLGNTNTTINTIKTKNLNQ